ncbi:MAG: outer membrane protein assembly factor, partial [Spirosomataceae bacterium]
VQTVGLGFSANLVRGYELNVIDGQTFFLGKTNFKYKLFDKVFDLSKLIKIKQFNTLPIASYATFYADAGYVRNTVPQNSNTSLGNKWLYGGGVGLDIITFYNTIGRFNYSVNREGEGRVYFTVVRGF